MGAGSVLTLLLLVGAAAAAAGDGEPTPDRARADLIVATREYRGSLERVLTLKAREVDRAAALVDARRAQHAMGLVARRDVEEAARGLDGARASWQATRQEMMGAERALAEALAGPPLAVGEYRATDTLIGYHGPARWSLAEAPRLERFFRERFGQALPVSAYGQSSLHDRLGFDHREALDVALHPDSREGAALLAFLQSTGIPFLAFRGPIAGEATGAHIHVGVPSPRAVAPRSPQPSR